MYASNGPTYAGLTFYKGWHRNVDFIAHRMLAHRVASWYCADFDRGTMGRYAIDPGGGRERGVGGGGEGGEGGGQDLIGDARDTHK